MSDTEAEFNEFRKKFNKVNRIITLAQFRALPEATLTKLIRVSRLNIVDEGQARLFHPSSQLGKSTNPIIHR